MESSIWLPEGETLVELRAVEECGPVTIATVGSSSSGACSNKTGNINQRAFMKFKLQAFWHIPNCAYHQRSVGVQASTWLAEAVSL